jgi:CheY-like chemotaxis protein
MRQRTVLLLEDEPVIALDMREALEASGCRVVTAADAQEAIALSGQQAFDLAILNYYIKGSESGLAVASQLRLSPHARLLFITGANPTEIRQPHGFESAYQVLHKPYSRRQLRAVLLP